MSQDTNKQKINNVNDIVSKNLSVNDMFSYLNDIEQTIKSISIQKSNIKASEFYGKYAILFTKDGKNLPQEEGNRLYEEWSNRVDLFSPINVRDDSTDEILFTLPANYNRLTPLNEFKGEVRDTITNQPTNPTLLPDAFTNIMAHSDDERRKALITNNLVQATKLSQKQSLKEQVQLNQQLTKQFFEQKYDPTKNYDLEKENNNDTNEPVSTDIDSSDIIWE